MKNIISSSVIISAPLEKVWHYISDFSHAEHQVIAVESTRHEGDHRIVTFKNGHTVAEKLLEKSAHKKIKWSQESKKGFVPIKNVEVEVTVAAHGEGKTNLQFSFYYDTVMGPIGWMMNILMVKSKLAHITDLNSKKIQKHFEL